MKHGHLFDPEHIEVLESEDRKMWQSSEEILGSLKLQSSWVAVDLGCGSGYFTVPLSQKVKRVYAVDVQKEMLNFLEDKIKRLAIKNIEPRLSKPNEIPLEDGTADLLMSVNTLHEFSNRDRMIDEMKRVLKKGGKLLIADFKKNETGFGPPVSIRVSAKNAIKLFETKGFTLSKALDLRYHYLLIFVKA